MKGIVESLGIGELAEQIKSVSAALEAANKDFLTFSESIKGIFNDLIATYKEVKKAANYQELGEGTKKFQKQMEELTEAQKAQAAQMEICFMSLCLTSFALVCV